MPVRLCEYEEHRSRLDMNSPSVHGHETLLKPKNGDCESLIKNIKQILEKCV